MTTPLHEKEFPVDEKIKLPRPFILRRLHSLLGLWLVVYLFEHLLVNAQMALYFQNNGSSFVNMVNKIHALPFLKAIEIIFLGLPFLIHGAWGITYARQAKLNAHRTEGKTPGLPQFKRNRAFSWQRITSWLLIVGIVAHVVHMRFIEYPTVTYQGDQKEYAFHLPYDPGLPEVAQKLSVSLSESAKGEVLAVAPSAGAAFFLIVRETFTHPLMVILYSILVVAATYHAFNGLWTFMITWGITLTRRSQRAMRLLTTTLMALVMLFGLMAAWGTYWTTLFQK